MRSSVYLICNERGVDRMTKTKLPKLKGGEVAVKLTVAIDDKNFRSPLVDALLEVDDSFVIQPEVDVEVENPPLDDCDEHFDCDGTHRE